MPTTDYRLIQIHASDIVGADAAVQVTLRPNRSIQSAAVDGDGEALAVTVRVRLNAAERNGLQAVLDRAAAKMDGRRAAKQATPSTDLNDAIQGEAP